LSDFFDRPYGQLSGGQRRRADLARALLHQPQVIFLDEPTSALDPHSREQVWQAITEIRQCQDTTVVLTTHYLAETERADQVCIIDQGLIVAQGSPVELRQQHSQSQLTIRLWRRAVAQQRLADSGWQLPASYRASQPATFLVSSAAEAKALLNRLGDEVIDFEFRHGSMDDVFLKLTGRGQASLDDSGNADRFGVIE
jgi:multidrug/hemolysin transport system ATP-binding protein